MQGLGWHAKGLQSACFAVSGEHCLGMCIERAWKAVSKAPDTLLGAEAGTGRSRAVATKAQKALRCR